jgi:hypothetical protein
MILTGRSLNQYLGQEAGNVVALDVLFLIAATALLGLAGCGNEGAQLVVQGKPVSGYLRLSEEQVGYMGSGKLQGEDGLGFHRPEYLEGGRLNVGAGDRLLNDPACQASVRGCGSAAFRRLPLRVLRFLCESPLGSKQRRPCHH